MQCSPKQRDNYIIYYYYCNRTGKFTSKGHGKRSVKQQGTSKIGGHCTAYIRVKEFESGEVEAEICDHHIHEKKLVHLPLSDSVKKMIAAKLQDGVSISSVMDFIRDNVEGQLGRRELVTHQDIRNIQHQYNIEGIKLNADDAKSVSLWVQYFNDNSTNDNPVLLYKSQGTEPDDDLKDLNKDDFVICIQTPFQLDMLREFGQEAVCVDSTHGTNVYDFKLITVLVLDELGEGIPVAWMISNREDSLALTPFFRKIREKSGDITAKVFMSDDANNFFNAWKSIFTVTSTRKLICAWHIDQSWRRSLQKHVSTISEQANVYHYLRVLLTEKDVNLFHQTLQQFTSWLREREELGSFCQYFQKEYSKNVEQWAPCYRGKCSVNTNMALEAFHRVLKVCYMEKKQNRRIDFLLHLLLKISRDKVFERFIKTQKGKSSHRICEISKRHRNAEKLIPSEILSIGDGIWTVKSASSQQTYYSVEKKLEVCSCKLRCKDCNVCIHQYSCTCMDFLIHSTICKHIHLVMISCHSHSNNYTDPTSQPLDQQQNIVTGEEVTHSMEEKDSVAGTQTDTEKDCPDISQHEVSCNSETDTDTQMEVHEHDVSSLDYLSSQVNNDSKTSTVHDRSIETCKKIEIALMRTTSIDAVKTAEKHLKAALAILNATEVSESLNAHKRVAPNTHIQQQIRFHSTKKKRQHKQKLSKPNEEELLSCHDELYRTEITVCGICLKEHDAESGQTLQWIQCDNCNIWLHQTCAEVSIPTTTLASDYYCKYCISTSNNVQ